MKPILALLLSAGIASAHHGQDFFVTLDSRVPASGGFSLYTTAAAGKDDFTLESGLLAGLGAGLAAGFAVDFDDANSFQANGITPTLQWSLTPGDSPLRLGTALSYHFHDSSHTANGGGGHSHGGHSHSVAAPAPTTSAFGFATASLDFNPDAPPPPTPQPATAASGPSSIHLHNEDYFLGRLIIEYEFDKRTRFVGNLILAGTSTSDAALGYAIAVRHELSPKWAAGMEAIGDFNTSGYHQIVASLIHSPRHDLGLRLGIAHGLGASGEGTSVLAGATWRF